jgi:hypothetical protein
MKFTIDSVKMVDWYDGTRQVNTNARINKEVLSKIKV